ncbi:hypothetical protein D3C77_677860 [compost metagenome]
MVIGGGNFEPLMVIVDCIPLPKLVVLSDSAGTVITTLAGVGHVIVALRLAIFPAMAVLSTKPWSRTVGPVISHPVVKGLRTVFTHEVVSLAFRLLGPS